MNLQDARCNNKDIRSQDSSADLEKKIVSSFALSFQLDEPTDMSGLAILLLFVRHLVENKIKKNLLSICAAFIFLPFSVTHLCEAGFSVYVTTKSGCRIRRENSVVYSHSQL